MKNQVKWSIKPEKVEKGGGDGGQGAWGKWKKEPGQKTETLGGVVDVNPAVLITLQSSIVSKQMKDKYSNIRC